MYKSTFLLRTTVVAIAANLIVGCNTSTTSTDNSKPPTPQLDPIRPTNQARKPGDYCFYQKDSNASLEGRLTYNADGIAEGNLRGTIVDADNGAEAITNTAFKGSLKNDTLYVEVVSDESGARLTTQEKWIWKDNSLTERGKVLNQIACK